MQSLLTTGSSLFPVRSRYVPCGMNEIVLARKYICAVYSATFLGQVDINCLSQQRSAILVLLLSDCCAHFLHFLSQDDREKIFLMAEREIAKMLAENLLNKFKFTKEYKEVVGDTFFEDMGGKHRVH